MTRKRKCRDSASGLPGGLSIKSFVEAGTHACVVQATDQAMHVVEVKNRSLLRFKVSIVAQSESDLLYFPPDERSWTKSDVHIGDRPEAGPYIRKVSKGLACHDTSTDECITVSVKYEAIGTRCSGSAELSLLVDTRA